MVSFKVFSIHMSGKCGYLMIVPLTCKTSTVSIFPNAAIEFLSTRPDVQLWAIK